MLDVLFNVDENENYLIINFYLPGYSKDDIDVSLVDNSHIATIKIRVDGYIYKLDVNNFNDLLLRDSIQCIENGILSIGIRRVDKEVYKPKRVDLKSMVEVVKNDKHYEEQK